MLKHPQNKTAKIFWLIIFSLVLIAGVILLIRDDSPTSEITQEPLAELEQAHEEEVAAQTITPLKEQKLTVPFTPQAPTANWDELHNEACEEASVIMAWAYYNNITSLSPAIVETEIAKLTKWQQSNYGYNLSITTQETARIAKEVYGLNTEVKKYNPETIKLALSEGKLVIIPAQGQLLSNPYFTPPGPPYHMLVITGYYSKNGKDYFITNDPGTRRGKDYEYSFETITAAAGNYSHTTKKVNTSDQDIIIINK